MVVINPWYEYFVIHNLHKDFRRTRSATRRPQYPLVVFLFCDAAAHLGLDRLILEVSRSRTNRHIHASGRTPLNEWSARRRGRCLYNEQQIQKTNIHSSSGIRNRNPRNRGTADLRLRPHGHGDRLANPTHLAITFALPSPHFPSKHGHKVETRRSMLLFFKNNFE